MELKLMIGDITKVNADVIVNAANKELWLGGGVCGAIHRAAGPGLEKECLKIKKRSYPRGLPVGEVLVTNAYDLPAKKVFHTVGPMYGEDDITLLMKCYSNCILEADNLGFSSIVFPARKPLLTTDKSPWIPETSQLSPIFGRLPAFLL